VNFPTLYKPSIFPLRTLPAGLRWHAGWIAPHFEDRDRENEKYQQMRAIQSKHRFDWEQHSRQPKHAELLCVLIDAHVSPLKQQDAKEQGPRPRKKSSFFTKLTGCFSGWFDLKSTLAGAFKCPHTSWKPGCRICKAVA